MPAKLDAHEVMERECLAFMKKHMFVRRKQMDQAALAVARAANVARYGANNAKEAQGLRILFEALKQDGRLACHPSYEKGRADFCVYAPGALALGVQLKTTGVDATDTGSRRYIFSQTAGYAGLLMVLVAVHVQPPRIWLADGARVATKFVKIPVQITRKLKSDHVREVNLTAVADAIHAAYVAALTGASNYVLRSPADHERPTELSALAEYTAFKRLQQLLPVKFEPPPVEHLSYDYIVAGKKWQLKLTRYCKRGDGYLVNCHKNAGRINGKQNTVQYDEGDFDFLCLQLRENTVDCCYLLPGRLLVERGLIGDASKATGSIWLYPHRPLRSLKDVYTNGLHWAEPYRIDFNKDPLAKLASIVQMAADDYLQK